MTALPDCPHCDARETLSAIRIEPRGVIVAECSCCSAVVRVNAEGAIVHGPERDTGGEPIDGP